MMKLIMVVASWSKSCQKVEKLSKAKKPQRPEKSAKVIGLEEPSFLTFNTWLTFTVMISHNGETPTTVEKT